MWLVLLRVDRQVSLVPVMAVGVAEGQVGEALGDTRFLGVGAHQWGVEMVLQTLEVTESEQPQQQQLQLTMMKVAMTKSMEERMSLQGKITMGE